MSNSDEILKLIDQYKFVFVFVLFIFLPVFFIDNINFTMIGDIETINDTTIYVGEGEPCESFYTRVQCLEGLECVLTSSTEHRTGICMREGTNLSEDGILRNSLIIADDSNIIREIDSLPDNLTEINNKSIEE